MSRSYREPVFKDTYGKPYKQWAKRQANKKIRRSKDVPNGKSYKKFYDSWNIVDYKSMWNPNPEYVSFLGYIKVIYPIPEWKARMK